MLHQPTGVKVTKQSRMSFESACPKEFAHQFTKYKHCILYKSNVISQLKSANRQLRMIDLICYAWTIQSGGIKYVVFVCLCTCVFHISFLRCPHDMMTPQPLWQWGKWTDGQAVSLIVPLNHFSRGHKKFNKSTIKQVLECSKEPISLSSAETDTDVWLTDRWSSGQTGLTMEEWPLCVSLLMLVKQKKCFLCSEVVIYLEAKMKISLDNQNPWDSR